MAGYKINDITTTAPTTASFNIPIYDNTSFKKVSVDTLVADSITKTTDYKNYAGFSDFSKDVYYNTNDLVNRNGTIYLFTANHEGLWTSTDVSSIDLIEWIKSNHDHPIETVNVTITSEDPDMDLTSVTTTITYGTTTVTKTGSTFSVDIPSCTLYTITPGTVTGYTSIGWAMISNVGETNKTLKYYLENSALQHHVYVCYKNSSNNTPVSTPPTCVLTFSDATTMTGTYDTTNGEFRFDFATTLTPSKVTINGTDESITMSNGYGIIVKQV